MPESFLLQNISWKWRWPHRDSEYADIILLVYYSIVPDTWLMRAHVSEATEHSVKSTLTPSYRYTCV